MAGWSPADLVNTAARLQSVAVPGTVLVGEATYRAASGANRFEPVGEQRQGQDRARPGLAGPGRRRASGRLRPQRDDRAAVRRSRRGATRAPGSTSTRPNAKASLALSPSWARPASARAGSPGSSRSTSMASSRRSSGMRAGRPRMATASATGRSPRSSAAGPASAEFG